VANVFHELSPQVGERGEHTASDDVALDLAELELGLVEPRGVRRGEVHANARMTLQEIGDLCGLVAERLSAIT
jgi:hypothetical protein